MNILLAIVAIVPGLIISYYIYLADKYERESILPLVICFMIGMLSTLPAILLEEYVDNLGFDVGTTLLQAFVFSMFGVALIEEFVKFLGLTIYPYRASFFNEPMDGIVYSVFVAMGFATLENLLYAQNWGMSTAAVRAFTAVPAHATFGVIMGYFIGLSRTTTGGKRFWHLFQGLILASFLHAVYDFFILQQVYEGLIGLSLLTLILGIYLSRKLIKMHQEASPFRREKEKKEVPEFEFDENNFWGLAREDTNLLKPKDFKEQKDKYNLK